MFPDLRVQKYGGSSLSSIDKVKVIAAQVAEAYKRGDRFLLVVSAMGQSTNELLAMAKQVTASPSQRELDMLLTAGERISVSLMALALQSYSVPSISFTGSQAGIVTNDVHGDAEILAVRPHRVVEELQKQKVVILAGFQGVSEQSKDVTTLGRGGTDTTAIAMASFFGCRQCEFMKDTEGIFDRDPHQHPDAQHLPRLSWQDVVEKTREGSPFLHQKAALMAQNKQMPLVFRHAHHPQGRSTIVDEGPTKNHS